MKIAILSANHRQIGGCEMYLAGIIPALMDRGHETAFCCEAANADPRPEIAAAGTPQFSLAQLGRVRLQAELSRWQPDLIFSHGFSNPEPELELIRLAPSVFFAHVYHGTCISGAKAFKFPRVHPCARRFGWKCLLHYYPYRCGGWHPLTMWRQYQRQKRRLAVLRCFQRIVTHSEHLRSEYLRHAFPPDRVVRIPHAVFVDEAEDRPQRLEERSAYRLLFAGRMDTLKGGQILLDALPLVRQQLELALEVEFVGDGPAREQWYRRAMALEESQPAIRIRFSGWLDRSALAGTLQRSDLLVVPSLWPEPYGQIGLEAGNLSVPSVAFAVGGIPEWLCDGINGHLAPGNPPTARGLTAAIVRTLKDAAHFRRLQEGARRMAKQMTVERHLLALEAVFVAAIEEATPASRGTTQRPNG